MSSCRRDRACRSPCPCPCRPCRDLGCSRPDRGRNTCTRSTEHDALRVRTPRCSRRRGSRSRPRCRGT
eukprot:5607017-Heterocapsa_arctica.AAC.1